MRLVYYGLRLFFKFFKRLNARQDVPQFQDANNVVSISHFVSSVTKLIFRFHVLCRNSLYFALLFLLFFGGSIPHALRLARVLAALVARISWCASPLTRPQTLPQNPRSAIGLRFFIGFFV